MYQQEVLNCATCERQIVFSNDTACPECQTPLEVSRSVLNRGGQSRFVSVLGASGAGKTVYLGMLIDILSQAKSDLHGVPNGVFSVTVQQQTVEALESRRFPEKTPVEADQWNWVHCEAFDRRKPKKFVDIITPDLAGEAIALELDKPGSFPAIRTALRNSNGAILLFDSESVRDQGRNSDLFGTRLVTYLASLQSETSHKKRCKLKTPLAIVFTKADCCFEAVDDSREFAKMNMPGFTKVCQSKFSFYDFFATSIVGATTTCVGAHGVPVQIPLHVEPRGIIEPLQWIMKGI